MNLKEAYSYFEMTKRAEGLAKSTIIHYRMFMRDFCKTLDKGDQTLLVTVTALDYSRFIAGLRKAGYADATIRHAHITLIVFFNWCADSPDVDLDISPLARAKKPKQKKPLPKVAKLEDVHRLIGTIDTRDWVGVRDKAILQLMLDSGLRVGEVSKLDINDIDIVKGLLHVRAPKNGTDRLIPLSAAAKLAVTGAMFTRPETKADPEALFLGADSDHIGAFANGRFTSWGIRQMLKRRCNRTGIQYFNPHSIRHLAATEMLNRGIRAEVVSRILGHASVDFTLKTYAKLQTETIVAEYLERWQGRQNAR